MARDTLPPDAAGNGVRMRTLEFDEADAPMLMRAMSIAACTAMMCGGKESVARLAHYQEQFAKLAPEAAKLMDRDTDLCEIGVVATGADHWTIHRVREGRWSDRFRSVVTIGERRFLSQSLVTEPEHEAIAAMVADVVPLGCERREREDVTGSPWRA